LIKMSAITERRLLRVGKILLTTREVIFDPSVEIETSLVESETEGEGVIST